MLNCFYAYYVFNAVSVDFLEIFELLMMIVLRSLLVFELVLLGHIACIQCIDAVCCYRCSRIFVSVCLSVCLSVGHNCESCKMTEPIEMPFGAQYGVGWAPGFPQGRGSFAGDI